MSRIFKGILLTVFFYQFSFYASAYTCTTAQGVVIGPGGGVTNVYVSLTPSVGVGQNLVVDLSTQIRCHNDYPETIKDFVSLRSGSAYGGALQAFRGSLTYAGSSYPFPTTSETKSILYDSKTDKPWPTILYLTATGAAGGVAIKNGDLIAILNMHQTNDQGASLEYIWNIYANNNVVIPTGGCDVSARDVTVNLPVYPATQSFNINVHCAQTKTLAYYLTGPTANASNDIFSNVATASPAQGLGVQISNNNGIIRANNNVLIGQVGTSNTTIPLTASYARTRGQVTAGSVRSVIGMTFIYP